MIVAGFMRLCVLVAVLAAASLRGWETEAGGRVCDVTMAHTLFFFFFLQLFIFSDSGWYRLRLFEAQVMRVVGVLTIVSHVNPGI